MSAVNVFDQFNAICLYGLDKNPNTYKEEDIKKVKHLACEISKESLVFSESFQDKMKKVALEIFDNIDAEKLNYPIKVIFNNLKQLKKNGNNQTIENISSVFIQFSFQSTKIENSIINQLGKLYEEGQKNSKDEPVDCVFASISFDYGICSSELQDSKIISYYFDFIRAPLPLLCVDKAFVYQIMSCFSLDCLSLSSEEFRQIWKLAVISPLQETNYPWVLGFDKILDSMNKAGTSIYNLFQISENKASLHIRVQELTKLMLDDENWLQPFVDNEEIPMILKLIQSKSQQQRFTAEENLSNKRKCGDSEESSSKRLKGEKLSFSEILLIMENDDEKDFNSFLKTGDLEKVNKVINEYDEEGLTLLHHAILKRKLWAIDSLGEWGADMNQLTKASVHPTQLVLSLSVSDNVFHYLVSLLANGALISPKESLSFIINVLLEDDIFLATDVISMICQAGGLICLDFNTSLINDQNVKNSFQKLLEQFIQILSQLDAPLAFGFQIEGVPFEKTEHHKQLAHLIYNEERLEVAVKNSKDFKKLKIFIENSLYQIEEISNSLENDIQSRLSGDTKECIEQKECVEQLICQLKGAITILKKRSISVIPLSLHDLALRALVNAEKNHVQQIYYPKIGFEHVPHLLKDSDFQKKIEDKRDSVNYLFPNI